MEKLLSQLDKKLKSLYAMRPFSGDEMRKIRQIFRIEYNYSSNHIEGNSLTMQETRSLLFLEIDNSNTKSLTEKRKRDEKEMLGHDQAINQLGLLDKLDFTEVEIKSDLKISHKLIKELNKIMLVEDYKKRVIDENGDQFFVDVIVGQYKTKSNHVKRRDGSIFHFANVGETQALMQDLIDWYEENKNKLHPIILATVFHYKFIRIHPFDDGNGRVCRFLVNMILMNKGYPLFIVPVNQKDEYYDILEYMDQRFNDLYNTIKSKEYSEYELFVDYVSRKVGWSIDQMTKVRKRKNSIKWTIWGLSTMSSIILILFIIRRSNSSDINMNNDIKAISSIDIMNNGEVESGFILETGNCNFRYIGDYKYIDLYDGPSRTPSQKPKINEYTKIINISGSIEEVQICILSDLRDDHKVDGYSFEVKAYLGSKDHVGYINVGRINGIFFDKDSGGSNENLYGRFNGNETPFKQLIDLRNVIVADVGGSEHYHIIKPIMNFQKNGNINIGAYVEGDNHRYAGKIEQFRIIYKGSGEIKKIAE